ncbi:single-stranded DNA-binding protein [Epibacterium ulvae]|uniref:single-stranded DNA-binding protein n=1 Tax=Epibacterium ulvae TaxID=1156985 RepID=UPI0024924E5C|nr:single-stranded DNA-binding protein [Epibacterium ulvae]
MQKLIIAGRVGKDAVLRHTQGGDAVLGFSLAVSNGKDRNGAERPATWYNCSIWGKRAESLQNYISKGMSLTLEGRPTASQHEGKAYLGINVSELTFQSTKSSGQGGYDTGGSYGSGGDGYGSGYGAGSGQGGSANGFDDDEIPF